MITGIEVSTKVLGVRGAVNIAIVSNKTGKKETFRIRKDPSNGKYRTYMLKTNEHPIFLGTWANNHNKKLVWYRKGVHKDNLAMGKWLYKYIQHPCLYDKTVKCTMLWQNLL